jgi:AraC family transcriptional regulator
MGKITAPRLESSDAIHAAGIRAHYEGGGNPDIPAQWQKLGEMMPRLPPQRRPVAYGICFDQQDGLDYLAGIDIAADAAIGAGVSKVSLPPRRYAVFAHDGHVSELAETCAMIFRDWAPHASVELENEPDGTQVFLERYGPGFDQRSGRGDIEIWIPIK